ncbi:rRNA processing/ribosome biogenesis-domain-containing protein [Irpex lacteus]|nr:rRNA processing/ribosome biogenesis-domain-containing protein [Irpex lacteus]
MDSSHPLKILLQLHVASDGNAALHLPYVLSTLTAKALEPSSHSQKWTTRINSLIHSKDGGARWAGLCIALRTSVLSRAIMLECAQSWVTASLSFISRNESVPVLKACIRLLRYIFTAATGIPEFQRQVSTPNVPKFSSALLTIIEKHDDVELQVLSLSSLAHLIVNYPTLHRALQTQLNSTALRYLNGSAPKPLPEALVDASSGLYSVLHHLGGKVGAAAQWRKSVDETIQFAWNALSNLRTTYEYAGQRAQPSQNAGDPLISVPLNMDRLRIAANVLSDLLQTTNSRPVPVPIGPLVKLCLALLSCTSEGQVDGHVDATVHILESSAVPYIQTSGCVLLKSLAACARQALAPHLTQLYYSITILLEQKPAAPQHLLLLETTSDLLKHCPGLTDPQLPSRLMRAILPNLTVPLASQSEAAAAPQKQSAHDDSAQGGGRSRKAKKRARGYEGDEVFKVSRGILCPTKETGEVVLVTLDVVQQLLQSTSLSPAIQSLAGRILLALFTSLPHIPPSLLSQDLSMHDQLHDKLQHGCITFASGTSSNMSRSLGLLLNASDSSASSVAFWHDVDLILHPRVPPLVRALPHVESLSLFQAEESNEELDARRQVGVATLSEATAPMQTQTQTHAPHDENEFVQTSELVPGVSTREEGPSAAQTAFASSEASPLPPPQNASTSASADISSTPTSEPKPSTIAPQPQTEQPKPAVSNVHQSHTQNQQPAFAFRGPAAPSNSSTTGATAPVPVPIVKPMAVDDDEDEPMPSIDMGSDSDSE